ncbi:MAG: hypothetical protein FIB07_18045 [Candidatus Methanoperedens sp.]|nr:hypothetical protein [Candidatus Methanoperedens sp.]
MDIRQIGIIGAGTMGRGIAQVAAQNGFKVILEDKEKERVLSKIRVGTSLEDCKDSYSHVENMGKPVI